MLDCNQFYVTLGGQNFQKSITLSGVEISFDSAKAKCAPCDHELKTTRYFEEQVLRKRSYIKWEWCQRILENPLRREVQPNGRVRYWGIVPELGSRVLRVVTLEDGETVLNAFPDRNFKLP